MREAQLAQYNYILVIGAEEMAARTVNVRTRDNVVHGASPLEEFALKLDEEKRTRGAVCHFAGEGKAAPAEEKE